MSKGIYVDASGFGDAFEGILDDFMDQCTLDAKKAVQKGGNACKKQLQGTADPGMTGEYASGWRMRTDYDRFGGYYVRVYNASKPSLTHLLEFGHLVKREKGGPVVGRAAAHPHIEPAYETGAETILKELGR